jgi:O-antigen ligase
MGQMGIGRVTAPAGGWQAAPLRRQLAPGRPVTWLLPIGAFLTATAAGTLIAAALPLGVGLVAAICIGLLVAVNLPVALAVWVGILFVRHLPAASVGPTLVSLLVAFGWFATLRARRSALAALAERHGRLLALLAGIVLWATLSLLWSKDPGNAGSELWRWYVVALVFLVVATTVSTPAQTRLIVCGFVLGAVASVVVGIAGGGLESSSDAIERATVTEGRLQGGSGDPNFLAAGLVPAVVLAGGLMAGDRRVLVRGGLLMAIALLTVGLAATQSLATLVVFRGKARLYAVAVTTVILGAGALWFAAYPGAWERLTSFDDGGNGRSELWQVASRMAEDHPLAGVGLGDFTVRSAEYVREPGSLEFVRLIAERPHAVHNMYLQLQTELGVLGLGLFLAVVAACMAAAWRAASLLDAGGDSATAVIARTVLLAQFAMLVGGLFISYSPDERLWVLLALGPALLAVAARPRLAAT